MVRVPKRKRHILPAYVPLIKRLLTIVVHLNGFFSSSVCVRSDAGVLTGIRPGQVELQPIRWMLFDLWNIQETQSLY